MTDKVEVEDISTLLESSGFEKDFADKAKVIFETKLNEKVAERIDELETLSEAWVEEALAERVVELETKLDDYLSYISEEFMKENEIAITSAQKVMAAEAILEGVATLVSDQKLTIPESDVAAVDAMEVELEEAVSNLDGKIDENVALRKEVGKLKREIVLDTLSEDLSDVQAEKFAELTEDFSIEDEDAFISKAKIVLESFFKKDEIDGGTVIDEDGVTTVVTESDEVKAPIEEGTKVPTYMEAIVANLKHGS